MSLGIRESKILMAEPRKESFLRTSGRSRNPHKASIVFIVHVSIPGQLWIPVNSSESAGLPRGHSGLHISSKTSTDCQGRLKPCPGGFGEPLSQVSTMDCIQF